MSEGKNFWGPPIWTSIHVAAASLEPENAKYFVLLLKSWVHLLPCNYCRNNLQKKLDMFPPEPYLRNNHDAFFYSYLIHDLANKHITKYHPETPKISPPFDEVKSFYFKKLGKACKECK